MVLVRFLSEVLAVPRRVHFLQVAAHCEEPSQGDSAQQYGRHAFDEPVNEHVDAALLLFKPKVLLKGSHVTPKGVQLVGPRHLPELLRH